MKNSFLQTNKQGQTEQVNDNGNEIGVTNESDWVGIITLIVVTAIMIAISIAFMGKSMIWICVGVSCVILALTICYAVTKKKGFRNALVYVAATVLLFLIVLFVVLIIKKPN